MIHNLTLIPTLLLAMTTALPAATPAKPNILHIHADDHRPDGLHALGNPLLQTPNLDTLVERGMTFTHCYTMAELKASGQWDNTIIIFSGDNGLSLGEHGLFGKQNLYEYGGMHVPLVIAGPGIAKGKSEALVYLMDLFPTFAEFARAKVPHGVEGHSIVPILTGKETKVRDLLYTGYRDCQRAIRDERWKLIRYPLVNITQLFDLQNDPHELTNLADKPEHAAKVAEMMAKLQAEMKRNDDTYPLVVANPQPAEWNPSEPVQ